MLLSKSGKKIGYFGLKKAIVKSPIFGVKMSINQFRSIFACICKGWEVDLHHVFHHPEYLR